MGIVGDRIASVGSIDDVRRAVGTDAEVVNLKSAMVLPGFVDGHSHLEMSCQALDHQTVLTAPPVRSLTEFLDEIRRRRAAGAQGWLVIRSSFHHEQKVVEGRLLDRYALDAVSPGQPVAVLAGLHIASLNSAALEELGLSHAAGLTDGRFVEVDQGGTPTGVVTEIWDMLPTVSAAESEQSLRAHMWDLFGRHGITSTCTIPTSARDVLAMQRMEQAGALEFRVRFYVHVPRTAQVDDVLKWGVGSGFGGDFLRFGGAKIFIDGEGADPYGRPLDDTKWSPDELTDLIRLADGHDLQLMMHAVTPHAIRSAAGAMIRARQGETAPSLPRHRIEHGADYLDVADLPLVHRSGLSLVATPHFAASSGNVLEDFQPLRQIVDHGLQVIGGTDSTGTVPEATPPLYNIALASERLDRDGRPSRHAITFDEACKMFTSWAAEGCQQEDEIGVIRPGAYADLVFLTGSTELGGYAVAATMVGGRVRGPDGATLDLSEIAEG